LEKHSPKNITIMDKDYKEWIRDLSARYKSCQIKAAIKVNSEMLRFYWSLGRDIVKYNLDNKYGSHFYSLSSKDLQSELPDVSGLSERNLHYMKDFYLLYSQNNSILPQVAAELGNENLPQVAANFNCTNVPQVAEQLFCIPWDHHRRIIDKCKGNPQKALFFVQKTIENNWSRAVLLNFLDTDLYERQGKAITNFRDKLPLAQGDLAQQITKDPYCFDFLTLRERYDEKELKDALMDNIQKFLLELGNGFAFVGREVRLMVGEKEKFMDMLFYNIKLHCYVVLEVKVEEFDFSNVGQLGGYIVAVNHQLKGKNDNPTIGLLVCKYKDSVEAQYALEASSQPIGVSAYQLSKLIPEQFKSSLPSIEELENVLENNN